jgi:hypothetical protein
MRINWKKLKKNIPNRVRVKARHHYEVLWSDEFWWDEKTNRKTFGITRTYADKKTSPDQILLNKKQGDKETIHSYWHEYIHSVSEHYNIDLTESQVQKLEKSFLYMYEFFLTLEGKVRKTKRRKGKK